MLRFLAMLQFRALPAVVAVTAVLGAVGCARPLDTPCASPPHCPEGYECLANRCSLLGDEPIAAETTRIVIDPSHIAVVQARAPRDLAAVPPAVTFGSRALGATALYLRFEPRWTEAGGEVDRAFLLLEPMAGGRSDTNDVLVDVWRIREPWSEKTVTWLDQPSVAPPTSTGIARSSPPSVLRIEVTEHVRYFRRHRHAARGLVVKARPATAHGATFATGVGGGSPPKLEIYMR